MQMCLLLAATLLSSDMSAAVTDPRAFDHVLVPIFFSGERPGANGARWKAQLWARNENAEPVLVVDASQTCFFGPCFKPDPTPMLAHTTATFVPYFFSDVPTNPSLFLYAEKGKAEQVLFSLRVADVSRRQIEQGTLVPVVRESELRGGPVTFLDVALGTQVLALLRVYDVLFEVGHAVRIHAYDFANDAELATFNMAFNYSSPALGGEFSEAPGYIEVPLTTALGSSRVRVVVEPDLDAKGRSGTPVTKYWAFISITSNDDNQITVVSPQ
jgi:hypothetical protein